MVTSVGGTIHVNQQSNAIINKVGNDIARPEFQNLVAAEIVKNQFKHIQRVRSTEKSHQIDQDAKHEEQKKEQESSDMKKQTKDDETKDDIAIENNEELDKEDIEPSFLDLKI
jgi:hypothetical protein